MADIKLNFIGKDRVTPAAEKASKSVAKAAKSVEQFGKEVQGASTKSGGFVRSIENVSRKGKKAGAAMDKLRGQVAAVVAAYASIEGARRALGFMGDSIKAAAAQEAAEKKLAMALERHGVSAQATAESTRAYAASLQSLTGTSDSAIMELQALLLNMGLAPEMLDTATRATLDFAVATEKSATEAARQLAKTLGGYAGELGEVMPQVKALTAEQLKNGEAIKMAGELYEGFAEKQGKTLEGQLDKLTEAWSDFQEGVGFALLSIGPMESAIEGLAGALGDLGAKLRAGDWGRLLSLTRAATTGGVGGIAAMIAEGATAGVEHGRGITSAIKEGPLGEGGGKGFDPGLSPEAQSIQAQLAAGTLFGGGDKKKGGGKGKPQWLINYERLEEEQAAARERREIDAKYQALQEERRHDDKMQRLEAEAAAEKAALDAFLQAGRDRIAAADAVADAEIKAAQEKFDDIARVEDQLASIMTGIGLQAGAALIEGFTAAAAGEKDAGRQFAKTFIRLAFAAAGAATGAAAGNPMLGFQLGSMVGGAVAGQFHDGGIIRAHTGLVLPPRLERGEVPIIAQEGEAVLNREAVSRIGPESVEAMNRGASGSGITVNISAVDARGVRDALRRGSLGDELATALRRGRLGR